MLTRVKACLLIILLLAGCTRGQTPDGDEGPVRASSPTEAVEMLIEHLETPDFEAAGNLSYPGHAALAALAEGASFEEVAEALREGDLGVAANFWSGFAQGSGNFLTADVDVVDGAPVVQNGVEFGVADVSSPAVGERQVITREDDGVRVDLFASFGGGLAGLMIGPVELLLASQTEDAALILSELRGVVPSLIVASRRPWLPPEVAQDVVRLAELITRAT
jgi:hypothetical protein